MISVVTLPIIGESTAKTGENVGSEVAKRASDMEKLQI